MQYIIPVILLFLLILCLKKRKNAYNLFCVGAKKGINLVWDLMPYIISIMLFISFMQISGATTLIVKLLSPVLNFLGIDNALTEFVCLRPLTASGSLGIINSLMQTYGANHIITKTACLMYLTTESVFFSSAVYLSATSKASSFKIISISLFLCFLAMVLSANLARIFL